MPFAEDIRPAADIRPPSDLKKQPTDEQLEAMKGFMDMMTFPPLV